MEGKSASPSAQKAALAFDWKERSLVVGNFGPMFWGRPVKSRGRRKSILRETRGRAVFFSGDFGGFAPFAKRQAGRKGIPVK